MRRRKLRWLLALAGVAVLAAVAAFALWPRPDRITRENYDRIRQGMTLPEVDAILGSSGVPDGGGPPVPFDRDRYDWEAVHAKWHEAVEVAYGSDTLWWPGAAGVIAVEFEDGRATGKAWTPRAGPLLRLQHQWRRWFP